MNELACSPGGPLVVGIAGDLGGSTRTALAHTLVTFLRPAVATVLAHDAYRRDRGAPRLDGRAVIGSSIEDTFDHRLFGQHLEALRHGRAVRPPSAFGPGRVTTPAVLVVPRTIVIVEGSFLLWDPAVRAALDLKIYLDTPEPAWLERPPSSDAAGHGGIAARASAQLGAALREAYRSYVEPTRATADLVLRTAGHLRPLAEIAAAIILDRLGRHCTDRARVAS